MTTETTTAPPFFRRCRRCGGPCLNTDLCSACVRARKAEVALAAEYGEAPRFLSAFLADWRAAS